jgi:hypothetical protein
MCHPQSIEPDFRIFEMIIYHLQGRQPADACEEETLDPYTLSSQFLETLKEGFYFSWSTGLP